MTDDLVEELKEKICENRSPKITEGGKSVLQFTSSYREIFYGKIKKKKGVRNINDYFQSRVTVLIYRHF